MAGVSSEARRWGKTGVPANGEWNYLQPQHFKVLKKIILPSLIIQMQIRSALTYCQLGTLRSRVAFKLVKNPPGEVPRERDNFAWRYKSHNPSLSSKFWRTQHTTHIHNNLLNTRRNQILPAPLEMPATTTPNLQITWKSYPSPSSTLF